jgi:hypothetical protein
MSKQANAFALPGIPPSKQSFASLEENPSFSFLAYIWGRAWFLTIEP